MKLLQNFVISSALILSGGGSALGQTGGTSNTIAAVGSNLGAVSNPSGFSFGSGSSAPSPTPLSAVSASGVMGFQVWKQAQIDEAKQILEKTQAMSPGLAKTTPSEIAKNPKLLRLDQHLRQSQLNVEIAQELTVNDYFLIYLSQFKNKEALTEAARRLSPDEMAELLMSYQHYVSRADQIEAPSSGLLTGYGAVPASSTSSASTAPARAAASSSRSQLPNKTPRPRL